MLKKHFQRKTYVNGTVRTNWNEGENIKKINIWQRCIWVSVDETMFEVFKSNRYTSQVKHRIYMSHKLWTHNLWIIIFDGMCVLWISLSWKVFYEIGKIILSWKYWWRPMTVENMQATVSNIIFVLSIFERFFPNLIASFQPRDFPTPFSNYTSLSKYFHSI